MPDSSSQSTGRSAPGQQFHTPEPTLMDYVRVVSTRRWLVASAFLLVVLVAGLWTFTRQPMYRSTARLEISPGSPKVTPFRPVFEEGSYLSAPRRDFLETQMRLVTAERLLEGTITQFGVHTLPQYEKERNVPRRFKRLFTVEAVRRTSLVDVAFYWPDPKEGAQILDYHMQAYVDDYAARQVDMIKRGIEALMQKRDEIYPKLDKAREDLHAFKQKHNIISFEDTNNTITQALRARSKARSEALQQMSAAQARLQEAESALKRGAAAESLPAVLENQLIRDYRNQKAACEQSLREGLKRFGENHPEIKAYRAKLESVQENIRIEIARIVEGVRAEHRQTQKLLAQRQKELGEQEQRVQELNNLRRKHEILKQAVDVQNVTYDGILKQIEAISIDKSTVSNNAVRVVRRPKEEARPAKPRRFLTLALASIMGLALGVGLAFLLDTLDTTIKSKEHVSHYLGLSLLGYVPGVPELMGNERHHTRFALAVGLHPRSAVAESFRSIRTALSFSAAAHDVKRMMVTSASPSEGKTLVAINVAAAIAQTGKRVLLVDADMRKPAVHKILEADQTPGLTNLLVGEGAETIADVARPTEVPNFFYMPSGPVPPNPAELIGCERMKVLLAQMAEQYDRVIIDTPPVVNVTDAAVLCGEVGGVVFVVRGFRTQREIARRALEILAQSNGRLLGAVLNNVDVPRGAYYYDTYYRYHQYYYYSEDGTKRKRRRKERREKRRPRDGDEHRATA